MPRVGAKGETLALPDADGETLALPDADGEMLALPEGVTDAGTGCWLGLVVAGGVFVTAGGDGLLIVAAAGGLGLELTTVDGATEGLAV